MDETTKRRNAALVEVLGPELAAKFLAKSGQSGEQTTKATKAIAGDMQATYKVVEPPGPFNGSLKRLNSVLEAARAALPDTEVIKFMDGIAQRVQAKLNNGTGALGSKLTDSGVQSVQTKAAAPTGDPTGEAPWIAARPNQIRRNADSFTSWLQGNPPKETDPENFLGLGRIGRLRKKP